MCVCVCIALLLPFRRSRAVPVMLNWGLCCQTGRQSGPWERLIFIDTGAQAPDFAMGRRNIGHLRDEFLYCSGAETPARGTRAGRGRVAKWPAKSNGKVWKTWHIIDCYSCGVTWHSLLLICTLNQLIDDHLEAILHLSATSIKPDIF